MYNYISQEREKQREKDSALVILKMHYPCTFGKKDALSKPKMHFERGAAVHPSAHDPAKVHGKVPAECTLCTHLEKHN